MKTRQATDGPSPPCQSTSSVTKRRWLIAKRRSLPRDPDDFWQIMCWTWPALCIIGKNISITPNKNCYRKYKNSISQCLVISVQNIIGLEINAEFTLFTLSSRDLDHINSMKWRCLYSKYLIICETCFQTPWRKHQLCFLLLTQIPIFLTQINLRKSTKIGIDFSFVSQTELKSPVSGAGPVCEGWLKGVSKTLLVTEDRL